jgi:hypothetical protein
MGGWGWSGDGDQLIQHGSILFFSLSFGIFSLFFPHSRRAFRGVADGWLRVGEGGRGKGVIPGEHDTIDRIFFLHFPNMYLLLFASGAAIWAGTQLHF